MKMRYITRWLRPHGDLTMRPLDPKQQRLPLTTLWPKLKSKRQIHEVFLKHNDCIWVLKDNPSFLENKLRKRRTEISRLVRWPLQSRQERQQPGLQMEINKNSNLCLRWQSLCPCWLWYRKVTMFPSCLLLNESKWLLVTMSSLWSFCHIWPTL